MRIHRLGWLTTYTDQYEAMRRLFVDVLGLPVEVDEGTFAQLGPMADAEHDYVEVLSTDDPESDFERQHFTGPVAGFVVDDVVEARRELEAAGIEILDDIHWSTRREGYGWFHFRAPDGHIYGLMEGSKLRPPAG
ncbi:MAG TPA: VOC family protein [Candidatus Limnocylindrales bacterium]|nr:VOC family protein [Candidatus Limnocylindrales bacterium]